MKKRCGLQYYEKEIAKRAGEEETVVITKQEYEELKNEVKMLKENLTPKSINANSVLMNSINSSLNVGTLYLKSFTNEFADNFTEYFTYNEQTGEILCKKDGWYNISLRTDIQNNAAWTATQLEFLINNIRMGMARVVVGKPSDSADNDANSITLYIKEGDKLEFKKITSNSAPYRNISQIQIIKI